jgi:hypothetical protein
VGRGGDVGYGAVQWNRAMSLRGIVWLKEMNLTVTEFVSILMVNDSFRV